MADVRIERARLQDAARQLYWAIDALDFAGLDHEADIVNAARDRVIDALEALGDDGDEDEGADEHDAIITELFAGAAE